MPIEAKIGWWSLRFAVYMQLLGGTAAVACYYYLGRLWAAPSVAWVVLATAWGGSALAALFSATLALTARRAGWARRRRLLLLLAGALLLLAILAEPSLLPGA